MESIESSTPSSSAMVLRSNELGTSREPPHARCTVRAQLKGHCVAVESLFWRQPAAARGVDAY